MTKFQIAIVLFSLFACARIPDSVDSKLLETNDKTQWISDDCDLPSDDSLFYLDRPAPLFRKEFKLTGNINNAKLCITAAGYYRASINGKNIGENVLDPAWTDFSKNSLPYSTMRSA